MVLPLISVIVPVYCGAAFIGKTLQSLQAQTFENFEVLCVDDCSPDESEKLIRQMANKDGRIRYLKTPQNLGVVSKVMSFASDAIRGQHFAYSSQDDTFSPDWLESMIDMSRRTYADAVVPNLMMVDDERGVFRNIINDWRDPIAGEEAFFLSLDWTIPTNALWPARFLRDPGYSDFGTYADEYTGRLFFLNCRTVAFAKGEFHYYHGNPGAITRQLSGRLLDDTYTNFRLWRLTHDRFPGHEWDRKLAAKLFRSYVESRYLLATHRELAREESRLEPALAGMNSSEYLSVLRDHFRGRPLSFQIARMIICHSEIRQIAVLVHFLGRETKRLLRTSG